MDLWNELNKYLEERFSGIQEKRNGRQKHVTSVRKQKSRSTQFPSITLATAAPVKPDSWIKNPPPQNRLPTHFWHKKHCVFGHIGGMEIPVQTKSAKTRNLPSILSHIQSQGAMALDTSYHLTFEINLDSEEFESNLINTLPGFGNKIYRSGCKAWQGIITSVGPAIAIWIGTKTVLINIHYTEVPFLPQWLLASLRQCDMKSIDLVGPKALNRLALTLAPRIEALRDHWVNKVARAPMCLIPESSVVQFEAQKLQSHCHRCRREMRLSSNDLQWFLNRTIVQPVLDDSSTVRVVFVGTEHIRVLLNTQQMLSTWETLFSKNNMEFGTMREWQRIHLEMRKPCFPRDYPDTTAGYLFWHESLRQNPRRELNGLMNDGNFKTIRRVLVKSSYAAPYTGARLLNFNTRESVGVITSGRFDKTGAIQIGIGIVSKTYNESCCILQFYGGTSEFEVEIEELA